jgi:hypothetical protein
VAKLTPITIANLCARAKRYEVSDHGCPGLRVVVFPSKKKSFVVRYRYRGLQRKLTLGPCLTERGVAEPAGGTRGRHAVVAAGGAGACHQGTAPGQERR